MVSRQFIDFGLVGLSGVFVNLAVLSMLHRGAGVPEHVALAAAIGVSMVSNFLLNNAITFRARASWSLPALMRRLATFLGVCGVGGLINFAVASLVRLYSDTPIEVADLIGIVAATAWNYLLSANLVWRPASGVSAEEGASADRSA